MPLVLVSPYRVKSIFAPPTAYDLDVYNEYVTLLMHGTNNVDSAINTRYAEEVTNSIFTIGSGPPLSVAGKFGDAVRYGSNGYISSTARPFGNVGTNDFTFEFFTRINLLGGIGDHDYVNFDLYPIQIGMDTNRRLHFERYTGGWNTCYSSVELKTNGDWVHVAIARAGGITRMFFDGVLVTTSSALNNVDISQTGDFYIGARATGSVRTTSGNYDIDELRLTDGIARYTQDFIPPTKSLADNFVDRTWSYVTALLPLSSDLKDTRGTAVTVVGDTKLSTAQFKFGTQAAYFDGNEDGLRLPASVAQFDTGDFTIEAWINPEAYVNAQSTGGACVLSQYTGNGLRWTLTATSSGVSFSMQTNSALTSSTNSRIASLNKWTHIAAVRLNGVVKVFVNGYSNTGVNIATSFLINAPVGIGHFVNAALPYHENFKGHIQDVRITKAARYTQNFAVPTRAFTPHNFNVGVQLRFQNKLGIDSSANTFFDDFNHLVQQNQGSVPPRIATGGKFGNCVDFYTNQTALIVNPTNVGDFVIGTADYSVSGYAFLTSHNNAFRTFVSTGHLYDYHGFWIGLSDTNRLMAVEGGSGTSPWQSGNQISPNAFPLNQWVKFELTRKAGVTIMKMNDVEQLRWNSTFNLTNQGTKLALGARYYNGSWMQQLIGKLDDVRFYKY